MDWGDILTKIGVGLCLGFGVVTLAKLAKRGPGQSSVPPDSQQQQDQTDSPDNAE